MTKVGLAIEVARQMGCSKKEAMKYLDAVFNGVKIGLEQDQMVTVSSFGVFYVDTSEPRTIHHPGTGEEMTIPKKKNPRLRYSNSVKEMVNRKK